MNYELPSIQRFHETRQLSFVTLIIILWLLLCNVVFCIYVTYFFILGVMLCNDHAPFETWWTVERHQAGKETETNCRRITKQNEKGGNRDCSSVSGILVLFCGVCMYTVHAPFVLHIRADYCHVLFLGSTWTQYLSAIYSSYFSQKY